MATDVTQIAAIMRANKWDKGAALMDSWFARKVAIKPKYGLPDTTTITMNWVLGFTRARAIYDTLMKEHIWRNAAAQREIASMLRANKLVTPNASFRRSFGKLELPAPQQDAVYVNQRAMTEMSSDSDDLNAALARFVFNVVVAGEVSSAGTSGYQVTVREVGVYVKDSYDFEGDQFLGYWDADDNSMSMLNPFSGTRIDNAAFRAWRTSNGRGGDFQVYTDVKRTWLPSPDVFVVAGP
jgi:hypothetical protein